MEKVLLLPRVFLILAMLFLPLIGMFTQSQDTVRWMEKFEQRELSSFTLSPLSTGSLSSLSDAFEAYFNDRFGLRATLIRAHSYILLNFLRVSPSPKLVVGVNGWFFSGKGKEKLQGSEFGDYDELMLAESEGSAYAAELGRYRAALSTRQSFLAQHGTQYLFSILPGKSSIYEDFLDARILAGKARRAEKLARYLEASPELNFANLFTALRENREAFPEHTIYFKTDGHWNGLGAYLGYRALWKEVSRIFPNSALREIPLEQFDIMVQDPFYHPAFTALAGIPVADRYPYLVPKKKSVLWSVSDRTGKKNIKYRWKQKTFNGTKWSGKYRELINAEAQPFNSILIVGDSFLEKAAPFFAAHTKRLYFSRNVTTFPMELVEELRPQLVVHGVLQAYIAAFGDSLTPGT